MHNGGASMIIRRCVRILPRFRFFRKRSRSPSLNPASTRSCEPSHPPASRIEASMTSDTQHRVLPLSPTTKLRAALSDEGRDPLLRVVGAAGGNERFPFGVELIGKTGLE